MVYCTKCGAKNEDDALNCVSCEAPLQISRSERAEPIRRRSWEDDLERGAEELGKRAEEFGKSMENECFGLPHGGTIIGLIFGSIIIIIGVSLALGVDIGNLLGNSPWIGAIFIIIFGLLILSGALYRATRRKS